MRDKTKIQFKGSELPLDFFKYVLVSAITYCLINFALTSNTLSPVHHDDYAVLGAGFENMRWTVERPVSTNLAYFMGGMGAAFAFGLLNILTIAVPAMVLYFCARFMEVRIGWVLAVAFSAMTFSHLAAFEHGKYLGLITNLTSHFFGVLALIALVQARGKPATLAGWLAIIAYGLSVFSKEDFLLPPLLLIAYFGAEIFFPRQGMPIRSTGGPQDEKRWWWKMALSFVAVAGASVLFSLLARNPFLAGAVGQVGASAPYAVDFSPAVLWGSFSKLAIEFSPWHMLVGGLVFIVLWLTWGPRRRELLLWAMLVFCLILPYALISNHLFPYRVFAWLPWLSALVVVAAALYWRSEVGTRLGRKLSMLFGAAFFSSTLVVAYLDRLPRLMVAGWYESAQRTNQRMLESIVANKALLDREAVVGVVGVEGLSPWSNSSGAYLQNKLGFANRWVVFIDNNSIFFTKNETVPEAYISVASSKSLCEKPDLLVMKFDATGCAVPVRAADLCAIRGEKNEAK